MDINYTSNELIEQTFDLIEKARYCDSKSLKELEKFLKSIVEGVEAEDLDGDLFLDTEESFNSLINDSKYGEDSRGEDAIECPEVLELIYRYVCPLNENIELVVATSHYLTDFVVNGLIASDYFWEEDGTSQKLARNTMNPFILDKLSKSKINSTRYDVACNTNTSSGTLRKLASDIEISDSMWFCEKGLESFIQYAVLMNKSTPKDVLEKFASKSYVFTAQDFTDSHGWALLTDTELAEMFQNHADIAKKKLLFN